MCALPEHADDRIEWGCDADAEHAWHEMDCYACNGEEGNNNCKRCNGKGTVELKRCASFYVGPRELFYCRAVSMLEVGVPPWQDAQGWGSWPAAFVDGLTHVLECRALIQEEQMRKRTQRRSK